MKKRYPPRKKSLNNVKKENILLVDGNALFKLGFYGAKGLYDNKKNHIGGLYQFITIIRKLLLEEIYQKVYVFWDGQYSGKQRYKIYKNYKIDRGKDYENGTKPIDLDEKREKLIISQYLEELCIRQHIDNTDAGVEADDFIALYCKNRKNNENITICTSDRDLCQLINQDVRIYLCDKKVYVDLNNYNEFFKHHQSNSKLIKIIGGDNSDSIVGIKGVKETTLLKYFPRMKTEKMTLNEVISEARNIQEERLKDKKKPLKSIQNIIDKVTDGIQGKEIYKINEKLVDLSNPLVDTYNKGKLKELKRPIVDFHNRGIKNVYKYMKRDGIDKVIYSFSVDYLLPFKQLIEREKNNNLK